MFQAARPFEGSSLSMKAFADAVPFAGIAIQPPGPVVRLERPAPRGPATDEASLCAAALAGDARGVERARPAAQSPGRRVAPRAGRPRRPREGHRAGGVDAPRRAAAAGHARPPAAPGARHHPGDVPRARGRAPGVGRPQARADRRAGHRGRPGATRGDDAESRLVTEERVDRAVEVLSALLGLGQDRCSASRTAAMA